MTYLYIYIYIYIADDTSVLFKGQFKNRIAKIVIEKLENVKNIDKSKQIDQEYKENSNDGSLNRNKTQRHSRL